MGRPPILPVSAAVAAVALSASPALAAVTPTERHKGDAAVSFPLLALREATSTVRPSGHVFARQPCHHTAATCRITPAPTARMARTTRITRRARARHRPRRPRASPNRRPLRHRPRRQEQGTPSEAPCMAPGSPATNLSTHPVADAKRSQRIADHQPEPRQRYQFRPEGR